MLLLACCLLARFKGRGVWLYINVIGAYHTCLERSHPTTLGFCSFWLVSIAQIHKIREICKTCKFTWGGGW